MKAALLVALPDEMTMARLEGLKERVNDLLKEFGVKVERSRFVLDERIPVDLSGK